MAALDAADDVADALRRADMGGSSADGADKKCADKALSGWVPSLAHAALGDWGHARAGAPFLPRRFPARVEGRPRSIASSNFCGRNGRDAAEIGTTR